MEMHDGFHDNRLRRCLVNQCAGETVKINFYGAVRRISDISLDQKRSWIMTTPLHREILLPPSCLDLIRSFGSPNSRSTGVPSGPVRHGAKSGVVEPILLLERLWSEATRQRLFFKPNQATQKRWESRRAARRSVRVIASQTPPLSLRQATAPSRRPGRSRKRSSRCRT